MPTPSESAKSSKRTTSNTSEESVSLDDVIKNSDLIFQSGYNFRNWLRKHGKNDYIDFQEAELELLRNCYNSLDDDGSGSIGIDELEDPLIALGLVDSRQQVCKIVELVDEDGSAMVEFDEFLSIMKSG